jgi:hypothetical protein
MTRYAPKLAKATRDHREARAKLKAFQSKLAEGK